MGKQARRYSHEFPPREGDPDNIDTSSRLGLSQCPCHVSARSVDSRRGSAALAEFHEIHFDVLNVFLNFLKRPQVFGGLPSYSRVVLGTILATDEAPMASLRTAPGPLTDHQRATRGPPIYEPSGGRPWSPASHALLLILPPTLHVLVVPPFRPLTLPNSGRPSLFPRFPPLFLSPFHIAAGSSLA